MLVRVRAHVCSTLVIAAFALVACTDDGGSDPATGDETGDETSDVPNNSYCASVADWDPAAAALEAEIVTIVNQRRSEGADCGSQGSFGPAGPLTMNDNLRCAARKHSDDMATRNYFDHSTPEGEGPQVRIEAAEYAWSTWGENIAAGNGTAAATMDQWMNSDGHCANIMNPAFTEIGVGYAMGGDYTHVWTQVFGAPL